jgi:dienelactone hydrolase
MNHRSLAMLHLTIPALDLPLDARLHRPDPATPGPVPLVILAHGFKGFMDWGPWPWLAERLAEQGIACLRFNFSHNGIGPEPEVFTEFKLFEENTFTRQVAEARAVVKAGAALPGIDPSRIILLGHSLGGATALLAAGEAPSAVSAVITWAGVAGLEGLLGFADQTETWRRQGFLEVKNARTGQIMRLGAGLLEDWEAHRKALDVTAAVGRLTAAGRPVTAIQGTADTTVTVRHGQRLAQAGARLVLVEGGDHTFGARHPFQALPPRALEEALEATVQTVRSGG